MVQNMQLNEKLWWVGIEDFDMRVFDIVMHTENGSSFNSYILKGSEKTVLFETEKCKFFDEYKKHIESVTSIEDIDYIVMNHTEPDHAGGIDELLKLNPNIVVVGTMMAINNLKQIVNHSDFKNIIVKDREELDLGDLTLSFNVLPNLHWPDTMWTYCKELKALFPCDCFGCHFATEGIVLSKTDNLDAYWESFEYYFNGIFGPFKHPFLDKGLARFDELDVELICTGHGPVIDCKVNEIVNKYKEWCTVTPREHKLVVMPYVSAYGYTGLLANTMASVLKERGLDVEMYDMVDEDLEKVVGRVNDADGVMFGSPTIAGEALPPIFDITSRMLATINAKKPAMAFGSYGWSGEAVPHLEERLKQLRMNVLPGFKVRFAPSEDDLNKAKEAANAFADALLG